MSEKLNLIRGAVESLLDAFHELDPPIEARVHVDLARDALTAAREQHQPTREQEPGDAQQTWVPMAGTSRFSVSCADEDGSRGDAASSLAPQGRDSGATLDHERKESDARASAERPRPHKPRATEPDPPQAVTDTEPRAGDGGYAQDTAADISGPEISGEGYFDGEIETVAQDGGATFWRNRFLVEQGFRRGAECERDEARADVSCWKSDYRKLRAGVEEEAARADAAESLNVKYREGLELTRSDLDTLCRNLHWDIAKLRDGSREASGYIRAEMPLVKRIQKRLRSLLSDTEEGG